VVKDPKKVGLFFGSFNPIHFGHLIIADYFLQYSELQEIWFVISPQNPFKEKASLLDKRHRLYMVNVALEDHYQMRSSTIEFDLPIPSYTVDTLAYLEEASPDTEFALIMGGDNLKGLHKWKNADRILNRHQIYCYPRPGSEWPELAKHPNIHAHEEVPQMILSASYIRKRIKEGKSIRYLIPDAVRTYIEDYNLYK
jgi:nicotinate-nucleotide adenylyltransferase